MNRRHFVASSAAAIAAFCVPAAAFSLPQTTAEETVSAEELKLAGYGYQYPVDHIRVGTLLLIDMELVRVTKVFHTDTGPVFAYKRYVDA